MPSLQDIEQFKQYLNSLGNEPAILAKRGESIKDVQQPDEGLREDLSDLFGDSGQEGDDEGLDTLPMDFLDTSEDQGGEETPLQEAASEAIDEGLPDFQEEDTLPEDESFEGEDTFGVSEFEEEVPVMEDEVPVEEDAFSSGDFEEPFDFSDSGEEAPVTEEISLEEEGPAGEGSFDLAGFEEESPTDEEGFDVPEFGEEAPEEGDAFDLGIFEEPAEAEEAGGDESFGFGDLAEEVPGTEEAPVEEEAFDLPEFEEEAPTVEEGFDLPEFEEDAPAAEEGFDLPEFEEEVPAAEEGFDLPEFEEEAPAAEEGFDLPEFEEEAPAPEEDLGLPDFADETPAMEEEGPAIEETFDLGSFEEEPVGEEEGEGPGAPGIDEQEEELPEELNGDEFGDLETLDEEGFNLDFDELGDHFGISEEEAVPEAEPAAFAAGETSGVEDLHEGEEDYNIEDAEFEAVQSTLNALPRNLKLVICELIGEKGLGGDRLRALMVLLIAGKSAKEIAAQVFRITGKKIEIPAQYEKKTGEEFEAEQGTFLYAFKRNILPMLRIFVPAALGAALLIFVGVRFVYRPIKAWTLYKTGYEEIAEERYDSAESYFDRAHSIRKFKTWFYRYAEGYIDQKEFRRAEDTYLRLLQEYPQEREGRLALAELQGMVLGKYEEAEFHLGLLLDIDRYDKEALLLSGDMNMQWAIMNPQRYEHARLAYAGLISEYGAQDEYLFRMLRYFIRTDNYEEVIRLKQRYEGAVKATIDPVVYAEMGGYLIDKGELMDVRQILFRAMDLDETVPEIHYNLARLFRLNKDVTEEGKALEKAIYFLESEDARNPFREGILIDSYIRRGERLYDREEFLDAENDFILAREHYENARRARILSPTPEYGRLYARLADIYYYQDGDLSTADILYDLAEENSYSTPDVDFKRGYVRFRNENFKEALLKFHDAGEGFSTNENLLYATGNTFFERGDFFAAQGYYDHLIDLLENRRRNTFAILLDERPDHRALIENLMKVYNNQGVTFHALSLKTGDKGKMGEALYYFTESMDLYDVLSRDPETLASRGTMNLAYLNSRSILYPADNYRLQIYRNIPRDMAELFF